MANPISMKCWKKTCNLGKNSFSLTPSRKANTPYVTLLPARSRVSQPAPGEMLAGECPLFGTELAGVHPSDCVQKPSRPSGSN